MLGYRDLDEVRTLARKCYKVVALGGMAKWLLLMADITWSASVAFEFFTAMLRQEAREREEREVGSASI